MKRVSKIRLFVLLLLLTVGGCTRTEVEEGEIPVHALKDVDAGFTLNVLASRPPVTRSIIFTPDGTIETDTLVVGVKDTLQTRAASSLREEQESQIASLWVGQYDAKTGDRLFNEYIPSMTGTTVNLKLKQSQDGSRSRVYFVANLGDLMDIADEKTLKEQVLTYSSTPEGLPSSNLCGMTGIWEGVVEEGGTKNLTVDLTRMVAKITFTYEIGGDGFSFTPTSVSLKSVPGKFQLTAPIAQLADVGYIDYTGTTNSTRATMYWYLPENMAGTVQGSDAVEAEKKKIGTGVKNATCIELTGNAVQGGVTYSNVTFRFYPGSNENNYDIVRNSHYTMNVKLVGIDVSDERITVGEIPPIEVDPAEMPAKKGGEKDIQITARPGQSWVFEMPVWLSALLDGKEINSGATITHQGPAKMKFKAVEANPKAENRSVSFKIDVNGVDQEIMITQSGSTLMKGDDVLLAATAGSEGSSSFTATEGLQWLAALNGGDGWLGWSDTNPGTSGNEARAGEQHLMVTTTAVNPLAQARTGQIVVKAGASVGDATYTGLKQEITVKQAGSTVDGSEINISAEGVNSQKSSFTATAGLAWTANVTSGDWITLTGATSGSPTTGTSQDITFTAPVNPSSSSRKGEITVRAGDTDTGPTGKIKVSQDASSLTTGDPVTLAATKGAAGSLKIAGTSGLPLTITLPSWIEITTELVPDKTAGSEQIVEYKTKEVNLNSTERVAENISVKAGDITQTVAIKQSGSTFSVSETELSLEQAGGTGTVEVEGTVGLPWTVSPSETTNGITPDITSSETGNAKQTLTFTAAENTGRVRSITFTIAVKGGDHSKTVEVKQAAAPLPGISVTIDQRVLISYKKQTVYLTDYPPFDVEGTKNYHGCTVNETAGTMTGSYTIQVEKGQRSGEANYSTMKSYCSKLNEDGSGWRLPTQIELQAMYINKAKIESSSDASPFITAGTYYWSSSVYKGNLNERCRTRFSDGSVGSYGTQYANSVRCVRDI